MLHVLCHIGRDTYAVPCSAVERVLPFARLKELPGAPHGVAGLLNYKGQPVPVVDLCLLLGGHPARELMGTRILLCPVEGLYCGTLGLIVEEATKTANFEESDFQPSGASAAECLDGVAVEGRVLIQRMEVSRILPPEALANLGLLAAGLS